MMSEWEIVSIALTGIALFFVVYLILSFFDYRMADKRPFHEVSQEKYPLSDDAMSIVMELQARNFTYLGALGYQVLVNRRLVINWIFIHNDHNVMVELSKTNSATGGLDVLFSSTFSNGATVETLFSGDRRIHVESANYRLTRVKGSLSDTFQAHQREVADFFLEHGAPIKLYTMKDVISRELSFQQLHAKTRLRPSLFHSALFTIWIIGLAMVSLSIAFELFNLTLSLICGILLILAQITLLWPLR